jgi:hypothetical protein
MLKIKENWKLLSAGLLIFLLSACSSLDLPTVEESQKKIDAMQPLLKSTDAFINSKSSTLPSGSSIDMGIKRTALNRLLTAFANNKEKDLNIKFPQTKNLIREDKNILGIQYTNYIDVDKGYVDMDLKTLLFNKVKGNQLEATIEIEGWGSLSISGKYTGIPASVTSEIQLYLKENIDFKLEYTDSGYVVLKPQPKKLKLKTKFSIALVKWNIPWYQEIELQLTDLLAPIAVPFALATDISLPLPSKNNKQGTFTNVLYEVNLTKVSLKADDDVIHWRSDIGFKRK